MEGAKNGTDNGEAEGRTEVKYINFSEILPVFDPVKGDNRNIQLWIQQIEDYGERYGWDETLIIHYTLANLSGVAKRWRDCLKPEERTWAKWKALLLETFPVQENQRDLRVEAQNYRKASGQNITEYYFEKYSRCLKAGMSDEEIIDWVVDGLNNQRYRDHLGPLTRYKKPSELLSDLIAAGKYIKDSDQSLNPRFQPQTSRVVNNRKVVTCFKCSQVGHYARDCQKLKNNTTVNRQQVPILQLQASKHQKYIKVASINGNKIDCYIDLGSSCVTLTKSIAEQLKLTYYHDDNLPDLVGYGNGVVRPIGLLTTDIEIDGVCANVKIHVVPDSAQKIPLLVGHPFTEQNHVTIISSSYGLEVKQNTNPIFNIETENSGRINIVATEDEVIPQNYLGYIAATADLSNSSWFVEGGIRENGKMIPRCLVSSNSDKVAMVPVLNLSDDALTVNKGEVLARGEEYVEKEIPKTTREVNQEDVYAEDIKTDLKGSELSELLFILNESKDIFSKNIFQMGCATDLEMDIEVTTEKPVCYRPYRLAYSEREKVKKMIEELKEADIVEDSISPYASPILLVRKKTGELRLCIDYRGVNKITVKQKYPLPRIDDQIDNLYGKCYFTSLDLYSGYYQVPISISSRNKTAFVTPDGHYQWKRMPFGLSNAPAVFQKLISRVLTKLPFGIAMAYIDDILIACSSLNEAINYLREVLGAIRETGLTIRLDKCSFMCKKIDYLGFEISLNTIEPGKRKINAVRDFPELKDIRQVRSFVGLASYYRRFVRNFAIVMRPLTDLLGKNVTFNWGDDQKEAFEQIKRILTDYPVLRIYNPHAKTEVHTDACALGVGAVLLQEQEDEKLHPIAFYSRKTTREESKYSAIEVEALAIVSALEKFRVYLIGLHFIIKTDCNSLRFLESKREMSPRIARWFMKLSEFCYDIEYCKGALNQVADALSRNPVDESEETEIAQLHVYGITISTDWIAAMQRQSNEILEIREKLEAGDAATHEKFTNYNQRVYKTTKNKWRLYVPVELRYELIAETHKNLAHLGIDKTLHKLKESYYFPHMREEVTKYINRCINCLYYKTQTGKQPGFLHPLDKGKTPFHTVHADHLGPFVKTKADHKYVFVLIDGYSKYVFLKSVYNVDAAETIFCLNEFISHYGKPVRIITDRGTAFTARAFKALCESLSIQHVKVATATPRANGQVERINKIIVTSLSSLSKGLECLDWDIQIGKVQWALNNSVHRVTKETPSNLIFRYKTYGFRDNPLTLEIQALNDEVGNSSNVTNVEQLLKENQEKMQDQFNKVRRKPPNFTVGQLVLVRFEAPATGESRKLRPRFKGPYVIKKVLKNDRYVIGDIDGERQSSRDFEGVFPVDSLKPIPQVNS